MNTKMPENDLKGKKLKIIKFLSGFGMYETGLGLFRFVWCPSLPNNPNVTCGGRPRLRHSFITRKNKNNQKVRNPRFNQIPPDSAL